MGSNMQDILGDLDLSCEFCLDKQQLDKIIDRNVGVQYANVVHWFSYHLKALCKFEECVHKIENDDDLNSFYMELGSFLREISCPYVSLTEGSLTKNLDSSHQRILLLNYLASELQAVYMLNAKNPQTSSNISSSIQLAESETAAGLRIMLTCLGFPKPPPDITSQQLFSKVVVKVKEQLSKVPKNYMAEPLFSGVLSEKQWQSLKRLNDAMAEEYRWREDVLLKRVDVTMQSFTWSDRTKKFEQNLIDIYQPARQQMKTHNRVQMVDLLAARTDLLDCDKTSGVSVRSKTKSQINAVVMRGRVPDRGGRPAEIEPPPPEMPAWKQRAAGGHGRGGSSYAPQGQRQHGGGSSRVQSSWNATGGTDVNWGYQQQQQQKYGGGYGSGGHGYGQGYDTYGGREAPRQQQASYGQQQLGGAAYYNDFYGTGNVSSTYQQQQGDYGSRRGMRGGRGRGGYR